MPASIRPEYRLCRMFRAHALERFTPRAGGYAGPDWGITLHFRCVRCTTERHDTIDNLGELGARRYVYPADYELAADERPTTPELRLEYAAEIDELVTARAKRARARKRRKTA